MITNRLIFTSFLSLTCTLSGCVTREEEEAITEAQNFKDQSERIAAQVKLQHKQLELENKSLAENLAALRTQVSQLKGESQRAEQSFSQTMVAVAQQHDRALKDRAARIQQEMQLLTASVNTLDRKAALPSNNDLAKLQDERKQLEEKLQAITGDMETVRTQVRQLNQSR